MTNITTAHREAFAALRDAAFENFALFSCFVNNQPASAIVAIVENGGEYKITPLFVCVTDEMVLTDHDGSAPGPDRG
jgi:hypothetical protein